MFIDSVLVTEVFSFTTKAHNMVSEVAYNGNNPDGSISTTVYRKPPTQIATSTSSSTIHWPTNLRWSRHCTAGQEQSAQTSLLRTKRPSTSGRPSSTTGTREEYFNNMLHRLDQDPQMTRPGARLSLSLSFVVCLRQCDEFLLH